MAAGDAAQQSRWLPAIATGEARIAVAFAGLSGTAGAGDMRLDGQSLSGEMRGAMDVAGATHILVVEADGGMAIVAADPPGVAVTLRRSPDRPPTLADLAFTAAPAEPPPAANQPLTPKTGR